MEIITITVIGVLVFFVGVLCGCLSRSHETDYSMDSFYREKANRAESDLNYERVQNHSLREEIRYIHHNYRYRHYPLEYREPKVYCASVDEQKLADIITKGQKTAKQLVEDLNLPIPN